MGGCERDTSICSTLRLMSETSVSASDDGEGVGLASAELDRLRSPYSSLGLCKLGMSVANRTPGSSLFGAGGCSGASTPSSEAELGPAGT